MEGTHSTHCAGGWQRQSLSGHFGEEKNLFFLQRVEPWISQSIA